MSTELPTLDLKPLQRLDGNTPEETLNRVKEGVKSVYENQRRLMQQWDAQKKVLADMQKQIQFLMSTVGRSG